MTTCVVWLTLPSAANIDVLLVLLLTRLVSRTEGRPAPSIITYKYVLISEDVDGYYA